MSERLSDTVDEDARRRFELAWAANRPEPIDRYLPPPSSPGYANTLLELVLIELEMAWKSRAAGRGPTAEEYLSRFPALKEPSLLTRLLQEEYLIRYRHGESPAAHEYRQRFPDLDWTAIQFETAPAGPRREVEAELPRIPGLEIIEILGRGGMGVVYKARQTSLNRIVAVKQILPGHGAIDAGELTRFRNEAHAVARLRHPNIVQVHEVGEANGRPFLVLEFVDGGTLAKKLAGAPQPARAAAEMIATLARAVQAVHGEGLLHRDLKPGNILLSRDGVPKITDFGLTKRVDGEAGDEPLTETGAILGTPSYMAPEQASGRNREVGPAADTYALGAILYEALTGNPPFRGATPMETVMHVVSHDPVPPRRLQPKTPRDLETICLKCLEKEPSRRYASAAELADDLGRFLADESIRARPVSAVERGWRWCRRKPALAALVAFVAVASIGALTSWTVWRQQELQRERQAAEDTRRQADEDARRREQRRAAAENNRTVAIKELHAGRFGSAREFLHQANDQLVGEPASDPLTAGVAEQFVRVDRLATFYRNADRAERLAFLESDQSALRTCEAGLKSLGVIDHPNDWWTRLPTDDLRAEQVAKLIRDADHQLTLLAGLWVKEGQEAPARERDAARLKALEILKYGERYRQAKKLPASITGQILEGYVHASQFRLDKIRRLSSSEPESASDSYFIGVALFWLALAPDDWISQAVRLTFPIMGLNVGEPKESAERYLRHAVSEEPGHYWSHFWLGWCLLGRSDLNGAELAFTTCTTLRPEEGLAYAQRARVLSFMIANTKEGPIRDGLVRRFDADADRVMRFSPDDWNVQTPLLYALASLGRQKEALAAAGRILDLMTLPGVLQTRPRDEQEAVFKAIVPLLSFKEPVDAAEMHSVLALANVYLKKDAEALRHAALTAEKVPDHPRVHTVRGIVHLRKRELRAAEKELRAALAAQPNCFLARAGLSRTLEHGGDHEGALRSYEQLLSIAANDEQRIAAHLGCYRNLLQLGRIEDADKAMANARAIDPKAVIRTTK